jgi:surface antigen
VIECIGRGILGVGAGLLLSGCAAISFSMGGVFGDDKSEETVTGSVKPQLVSAAPPTPTTTTVPEVDWRASKAAFSQAMNRTDAGASVMWDNPLTGAHGSITPLSKAGPTEHGRTCRAFLLSRVQGEDESWHQGEACLAGKVGWKVVAVRPLAAKT